MLTGHRTLIQPNVDIVLLTTTTIIQAIDKKLSRRSREMLNLYLTDIEWSKLVFPPETEKIQSKTKRDT